MRILTTEFEVKYEQPGDWAYGGAMGRCYVQDAKILINSTMNKDIQTETLMHECLHAMADMLELPFQESEQTIATLSQALIMFIRDNPVFIYEILNNKGKK